MQQMCTRSENELFFIAGKQIKKGFLFLFLHRLLFGADDAKLFHRQFSKYYTKKRERERNRKMNRNLT